MNLELFRKSTEAMIKKNNEVYSNWYGKRNFNRSIKNYTEEEIEKIISSGDLETQQRLSQDYFNSNGFYRQIILYYANLLKYCGILIPNILDSKVSLEDKAAKVPYTNAVNFISNPILREFFTNCAIKALVDGIYCGILLNVDKDAFSYIDLPAKYCRSNFKSHSGADLIEFNLAFFNLYSDENYREKVLNGYPKFIVKAYNNWKNGKISSSWITIPEDIGICFPFIGTDIRPFFLNIIPATRQYEDSVEVEMDRALEEIRKIIVQKVPHTSDGRFLLEPDEVTELHNGAVGMMGKNKNVSVLTTYADIDSITSKTSNDNVDRNITTMAQHIYNETGVSGQLFASNGSTTLDSSIKKDISLMMYLANKFSFFITNIINSLFSNKKINFSYKILPVGEYNEEKYVDLYLKMANSGYSFLLPSVAIGINQRDLTNLKDLENNLLKLKDKLVPLSTSYTQSSETNGSGAPKKSQQEKSEKTIQNETSLDNQGGGGLI